MSVGLQGYGGRRYESPGVRFRACSCQTAAEGSIRRDVRVHRVVRCGGPRFLGCGPCNSLQLCVCRSVCVCVCVIHKMRGNSLDSCRLASRLEKNTWHLGVYTPSVLQLSLSLALSLFIASTLSATKSEVQSPINLVHLPRRSFRPLTATCLLFSPAAHFSPAPAPPPLLPLFVSHSIKNKREKRLIGLTASSFRNHAIRVGYRNAETI